MTPCISIVLLLFYPTVFRQIDVQPIVMAPFQCEGFLENKNIFSTFSTLSLSVAHVANIKYAVLCLLVNQYMR
jgi:hypothetical protein